MSTQLNSNLTELICSDEELSSVATTQHDVGTYFKYSNVLHITDKQINIGNNIVPNTNCHPTNIVTELINLAKAGDDIILASITGTNDSNYTYQNMLNDLYNNYVAYIDNDDLFNLKIRITRENINDSLFNMTAESKLGRVDINKNNSSNRWLNFVIEYLNGEWNGTVVRYFFKMGASNSLAFIALDGDLFSRPTWVETVTNRMFTSDVTITLLYSK